MNDPDLFPGLLTALGVGLMIGVVRERGHQPDVTTAGTRTHALVSILGYVSWGFGTWPFVATVLVVGALVMGGYQTTAHSDPGQTGEVALLVTLMLSAQAHQNPILAAGLGVLAAVLLYAKQASRRISRVLITEQELQDALMLAAAALVVMPVLSDKPVDPWGVLHLPLLWRIVVLVMAVGMFGHVARRALGGRWGMPLAGFFSGFVSSTAVVATMGLLLVVLPSVRHENIAATQDDTGRAFKLSHAMAMAGIIALMSLLAAGLRHVAGDVGVLVAALCVAWVEVHAAAASVAQLMQAGDMTPELAHWGLVAVMASSALAKTAVALASGGFRFGLAVGLGMLAMVAGASAGVWWLF